MAYEDDPYESGVRKDGDSKDSGEDTDLLPKSFFAGKSLEPGSKCEVEIVHVYDDEVAVKYVPHVSNEDKEEEDEDEPEDKPVEPTEPAPEEAPVEEPATAGVYD